MSEMITDYAHVLHRFRADIAELRDHIDKHRLTEGWELDVAEMNRAIELIDAVTEQEHIFGEGGMWDRLDGDPKRARKVAVREYADWVSLWTHIQMHMRKWWD